MFIYSSPDRHKTAPVTYGGYSDSVVVDEGFVLHIAANVNLAGTAPLLCAGITTYSPEPGTPSPPATPPTQPRPEIPPPPDEPTTPVNTVRLRNTVGICPERAVGIQPEFIPEPRPRLSAYATLLSGVSSDLSRCFLRGVPRARRYHATVLV